MRERLIRLDRLIEEGARNVGFGRAYVENQPLDQDEIRELRSFLKTDSFIEEFETSGEEDDLNSLGVHQDSKRKKSEVYIEMKE
jgi:hypothetical protein